MAILLISCAGYSTYDLRSFHPDHSDKSGLFLESTGNKYTNSENYKTHKVSKQDVINAWGHPEYKDKWRVNINGELKYDERWNYNSGIAVKGFMPIIIIPIPLFWWPSDGDYTRVVFNGDYVDRVTFDTREMELKCLVILPIPYCANKFELH